MKIFLYIIYNLIYLVGSAWFLAFANMYLNAKVLPDNLRWENGQVRENLTWFGVSLLIVLLIESGVLIFLNYQLNKWYVSNVLNLENGTNTIWWATGVVLAIIMIAIILINAPAYS